MTHPAVETTGIEIGRCGMLTEADMCRFLSDYGARLLASGATCIRLQKNISRMAGAYGMEAEFVIQPRHLYMTVRHGADACTEITAVPDMPISFDIITRLSRLSWEVADGRMDLSSAITKYRHIARADKAPNRWIMLVAVAIAGAAFCRLFGGDRVAMALVGAATLAGFYLKQEMALHHLDARLIFLICSFCSAVIGAGDSLFALGSTPGVTIGTSVLYLVPGIPFLNSFSDLLNRHYICAFSRFLDAVILTVCLSLGLCAAMLVMHIGMF